MTSKNFILATAGHVDHGKSALIRALTGTDPDRLPEEKSRGITIELGFAHLTLPDLSLGVIDVPGHEDFVKNMVAGVGAIDLALLVVAADDGWMPQTEEHLQILSYLGVAKLVVALTKADLVDSPERIVGEVRAQLRDTPFTNAAIVPTSIPRNLGLDELRAQLSLPFAALEPPRDIGKPRLFVDRVFTLRGAGTIVTGTLTGGTFRRGESIVVQPSGLSARIRSMQNHSREVTEIGPGSRVALNLPELSIAQRPGENGVRRGAVVTLAALGAPQAVVDVLLTRSARLSAQTAPLRHGARVRVHHGSGNFAARVFLQTTEALSTGESGVAEIRFSSPVLAFVGDRFVIRDTSERRTLGGGIVLDGEASAKTFRSAAQKKFLQSCARLPIKAEQLTQAQVERDHVLRPAGCLLKSCFAAAEIADAFERVAKNGAILLLGDFAVDKHWWEAVLAEASSAIDDEHRLKPERAGLELVRLREAIPNDASDLFDQLLIALRSRGFVRVGDVIKRETHRPVLPPALQAAGTAIRSALQARPFDPPSRKEIAPNDSAQQALRFLIETAEVTVISSDLVLATAAFEKMRDTVLAHLRREGSATVSELRQVLGSSRRVIVPFLEKLDRNDVTQRQNDKRILAH
jgi:selenocysteine-specific elongation factor